MNGTKMVTGLILIDTPASALNNAGIEMGRELNKLIVKKIRVKTGEEIPYVSGQAFKRWWRDTVVQKFKWTSSPVTREEKIAYTEGNPIKYEEDDIFGYMVAPAKGEEKGIAYRRIAPLKCTPLLSLFPNVITRDFGVFARGEGDPVPYEQEIYSTIMKGAFSLMINEVGVFTRGVGKDIPSEKDIDEALKGKKLESEDKKKIKEKFNEKIKKIETAIKEKKATEENGVVKLPPNETIKRVKETLLALAELSGGAKISDYLTDVSPKFIITAAIGCGNHIFMDAIKIENNQITLNVEAINEVIKDFGDRVLSPIYIGLRKGFLTDEEYKKISELKSFEFIGRDGETKKIEVVFGTPKEVLERLVEHI
jgi:CRISPR-associated protein Cst2